MNGNAGSKRLAYNPSIEMRDILNEFVQNYVFSTQQEGKIINS